MVGWTTGTQDTRPLAQRTYSCRLQYCYGYEPHTIAPPDNTLTQIPVTIQEQYPWTEQVSVDGQNGFATTPPGQSSMYLGGTGMGH
jgi:hypothetical protein